MKMLIYIIMFLCTFNIDYDTDSKCKVIVEHEQQSNTYDYEQGLYYPMLYGPGDYTIHLYEQVKGTQYKKVMEYNYTLTTHYNPFTCETLGITPKKYKNIAESLTDNVYGKKNKVETLANYVNQQLDYDLNCQEYADMFAGLCRSLYIECKLCKGYYNEGLYHAWNEVNIKGEWVTVDLARTETDGIVFRSNGNYWKIKEY